MRVPPDEFDLDKLPPHLRITFRVMDGEKVVATGKDLAALKRQLRPKVRATLSARATALTRDRRHQLGLRAAAEGLHRRRGQGLPGPRRRRAPQSTSGCSRPPARPGGPCAPEPGGWCCSTVKSPANEVAKRLTTQQKLVLSDNPHGSVAALFADCVNCAPTA